MGSSVRYHIFKKFCCSETIIPKLDLPSELPGELDQDTAPQAQSQSLIECLSDAGPRNLFLISSLGIFMLGHILKPCSKKKVMNYSGTVPRERKLIYNVRAKDQRNITSNMSK